MGILVACILFVVGVVGSIVSDSSFFSTLIIAGAICFAGGEVSSVLWKIYDILKRRI